MAGRSALRRRLPTALFVGALAAGAVALARPQATVAVPVERASVVLVTDSSRSMLADDVEPNRLSAAQQASESFLDSVPDELRVGAVGYSTTPHTLQPPTTEHDQVRATIGALSADGGTATGDALDAALEMLAGQAELRERPPAAIVLLSDGRATAGRDPGRGRPRGGLRGRGRPHGGARHDLGHRSLPRRAHATARDTRPGFSSPGRRCLGRPGVRGRGRRQLGHHLRGAGVADRHKGRKREITAGFAGAAIVFLLAGAGLAQRWTGRLP